MRTSVWAAACGVFWLAACAMPVDPTTGQPATVSMDGSVVLPLASVYDDGTGQLYMEGTMKAYRSGVSSFAQKSEGGFSCTGATDESWSGTQTCSDGSVFRFAIPADQRGKLSGAYLMADKGARIAVGWGGKANQASLTEMLAQ